MVTPLFPGISYARTNIVPLPDWAVSMLMQYLADSGLDRVQVNSTMRTAEEQARAMYQNELSGKHIAYGPPGQYVIAAVYEGGTEDQILAEMAKRLRESTGIVSYHYAPPSANYFAADLEATSVGGIGSSEYAAFIATLKSAVSRGELKELLHPGVGVGNKGYDPAIHVVFVQGTMAQVETATENLVTGGDAASYEGESDTAVSVPGLSPVSQAVRSATGIPLWAWGLLGFGGYLWYRSKKSKS